MCIYLYMYIYMYVYICTCYMYIYIYICYSFVTVLLYLPLFRDMFASFCCALIFFAGEDEVLATFTFKREFKLHLGQPKGEFLQSGNQ